MINKKQIKALLDVISDKNFSEAITYLYYDSENKRVIWTDSQILITIDIDCWEKNFYMDIPWLKRVYSNFSKATIGTWFITEWWDIIVEYYSDIWKERSKLILEDFSPKFDNRVNKYPVVDIEQIAWPMEAHTMLWSSKHLLLFHKLLNDLDIPKFQSRTNCLYAKHNWMTILSRHNKE